MSLPTSIGAYREEIAVLDRAVASRAGIRVPVASEDSGIHFRMRIHKARQIIRETNAMTYERGHPAHGTSVYDPFTITVTSEGGQAFVNIRRSNFVLGEIEELDGEYNVIEQIEQEVAPQLEAPRDLIVSGAEEIEDEFAPAPPQIERRF